MRVVLIRPPEINRIYAGIPDFFNERIFLFPPLGLMQLKSYIEKYTHHKVFIYDSLLHGADYGQVSSFVRKVAPGVVGISTFTHSLIDVVKTAEAIKKDNSSLHIVVGGPHTYTFHNESAHLLNLGCIDSVVLGDGEAAFKEIMLTIDKNNDLEEIGGVIYKNKKGEIVKRGGPYFVKDLDAIPFPSRDIPGINRYYTPASSGDLMTTIISSRGCPYDCKFCNVQKKYRSRSVRNIADEMELCIRMGYKEVFFIDDTFNVTAARVIGLSEEILRRKLKIKWGFKARCDNVNQEMLDTAKRAGCFRIHYGVETGMPLGLASINKKVTLDIIKRAFSQTKRSGIRTTAYFIIGCPHEKAASEVMETIDFAVSLKADFAVFSLLSPYPDTEFYRNGVERGVLDRKPWDTFIKNPACRDDLPTCWEEDFSKTELVDFLRVAHRRFYYRPEIIFNALFGIHSITELKRLLTGALSLLKLELGRTLDKKL